jgi:hypothetical protein
VSHKLDNLYDGLPIFVISTGTSLRGFDFSRLNGQITIGINRVIEYYQPSILHLIDVTAHKTHAKALSSYNGMIIAGQGAAPTSHTNVFEVKRNVDTFELSGNMTTLSRNVGRSFSDGLYGGGAGCTALHTAMLLGGNPIYLLGYDYYQDNGTHFDEYDESRNGRSFYNVSYDISFDGVGRLSRQDWAPAIYNCNAKSRLTAFPFIDIDTVLAHDRTKQSVARG